ncbi:DnaJ-like protein [Zancudomyces culisetae]|nr:DnaJ-like protein [Zancudomyces culisetae]|eukprot:OMH80806.1 DnaJ-like protein [Zancudomyces culisetae]
MPLHATLRALRADCYLEEGQVFEGVNDYIRLLGLRIGVSDKEKAKEYLRISHLQLYYLDLPAKAVEMIKTCLNQDPDNKMCLKQFKKIKKMHRKLDEIDKEYQKKKFNTLFKILETPADSSSGFIKTIKESLSESNKDFGFSESLKSRLIGRLEKIAAKSANHLKKRTQALALAKRGLEHIPEDIELLLVKAEALIGLGTEDDLNLATQTLSHAKKSNENNSSDSRKEEFDGKIRNLEQDLHKAKRELKKRDYYKILGVSKDATQSEIKKSYRKLAKIHHPDRHKGEEKTAAEAKMAEINLAYGVLGNEEERAKYDNGFDPNNPEDGQMHQHPHQHPGGFQFDFGNFQDQFFGHKRRGGFKNNFGEQFTFNFNF